MKITVQVLFDLEDGTTPTCNPIATLERAELTCASVGLHLDEAHQVLTGLQQHLITAQATAALVDQATCPGCGRPHRHKDVKTLVVRTLFGTVRLPSPRWRSCPCSPDGPKTFSPLACLLPERTTPELVYWQAKAAALVSYAAAADLIGEAFPLGRTLHVSALRRQAHRVAQRLEDELGEEQVAVIDGCEYGWAALPRPDLPLTVGIDGGYVRSAEQTSRRDGWFEVIAGMSIPAEGPSKCFAFVQTVDAKPKRRLFELLCSQGMAANQQVIFLTDGGEDVRDLPLYLNPQAEHYLDWFHVTMRLTVLGQMAKGLPESQPGDDEDEPVPGEDFAERVSQDLIRIKWLLWHGNTFRAMQELTWLLDEVDVEETSLEQGKFVKALGEFHGYIQANVYRIPNYGERYRAGEAISSACAESTINQVVSRRMVKKQQMRWSPKGAHLLLQIRTRVLNDELAADFARWYPSSAPQSGSLPLAA
jgi:hypothetical protein